MWFVYMAGMLWTWVYLQSCWSLWLVSWLVVSAESLKTRMQYIYSTHEIAYIYIYNSIFAWQQRHRSSKNKIYSPPNMFSIAGIVLTRPAIYLQGFATECCVFFMEHFPLSVTVCPSYYEGLFCSLNDLFLNPALHLTACVLFTDTTNNATF